MIRALRARCLAGLVPVAVALVAAGCGGGGKPTGTVAGKVMYNGAPVAAGMVNFLSPTGSAAQAKIAAGGSYAVADPLEAGEYKVFVSPPLPEPQPPGTRPAPPPKFEVPARFRDPASSATTVVVHAGSNDIPVEFKN